MHLKRLRLGVQESWLVTSCLTIVLGPAPGPPQPAPVVYNTTTTQPGMGVGTGALLGAGAGMVGGILLAEALTDHQ